MVVCVRKCTFLCARVRIYFAVHLVRLELVSRYAAPMKRTLAALAALPLLASIAACGGDEKSSSAPTNHSKAATSAPESSKSAKSLAGDEAAVLAAAQEQADRFSSSDFWDMWTKEAKSKVSRDDYAKVSEACSLGGNAFKAEFVRFENPEEAVVRLGLAGQLQSYTMKLEEGAWAWQPQAAGLETLAKGADSAIAALGC